jgi:DNA repair ATPase RecN
MMKNKKMKGFKISTILFATASLVFVSCNNGIQTKNTAEKYTAEEVTNNMAIQPNTAEMTIAETETNKNKYSKKRTTPVKKDSLKTRTYKMKDGTKIAYQYDSKGLVGFDDWKDFTVINTEIIDLSRRNIDEEKQRMNSLNYRIANLSNTIPAYLKTEEVMEDVADIQKEYLELIEDADASDKEIEENYEELSEKFADLNEELQETMDKYIDIHGDAIEEFMEEFSKGEYEDAIEEYNEEIKELDKMLEK